MKFIFICLSLLISLSSYSQNNFITVKTGSQWVPIMNQPHADARKITDIRTSDFVQITGIDADFYRVIYRRYEGWVHQSEIPLTDREIRTLSGESGKSTSPVEKIEAKYIHSALKYQLENDSLNKPEIEGVLLLLEKYYKLAYPERQ